MCDHGLCVSTALPDDAYTPDIAIAVDAARDAALDAYVPQCGTTVLLTDSFDDTMPGPAFTSGADTGLTVTEAGGHVDMTFAASVAANMYAYYSSATTYPTAGMCVALEISQVPVGGGSAYFKLQGGVLELEFYLADGMLDLRTHDPAIVTKKTLTFDPVAQRFWRLRQQGGTSYWDTAPDGVTYVQQTSLAGFFTPTAATITFGAGASAVVNNGGRARFEGVTARD